MGAGEIILGAIIGSVVTWTMVAMFSPRNWRGSGYRRIKRWMDRRRIPRRSDWEIRTREEIQRKIGEVYVDDSMPYDTAVAWIDALYWVSGLPHGPDIMRTKEFRGMRDSRLKEREGRIIGTLTVRLAVDKEGNATIVEQDFETED